MTEGDGELAQIARGGRGNKKGQSAGSVSGGTLAQTGWWWSGGEGPVHADQGEEDRQHSEEDNSEESDSEGRELAQISVERDGARNRRSRAGTAGCTGRGCGLAQTGWGRDDDSRDAESSGREDSRDGRDYVRSGGEDSRDGRYGGDGQSSDRE